MLCKAPSGEVFHLSWGLSKAGIYPLRALTISGFQRKKGLTQEKGSMSGEMVRSYYSKAKPTLPLANIVISKGLKRFQSICLKPRYVWTLHKIWVK